MKNISIRPMAGESASSGLAQLIGLIPPGLMLVIAIVGALWAVGSILVWLWKRRNGGSGMSGFPVISVIGGGLLASFGIAGPTLASLVDAIVRIFVSLLDWLAGQF